MPTTQYKFKLLRGIHSEGMDAGNRPCIYEPGDIIATNNDLQRHNVNGMLPRFELLTNDSPAPKPEAIPKKIPPIEQAQPKQDDEGWEKMTMAELRSMAAEEEIDLGGVTKKADLIVVIKGALS